MALPLNPGELVVRKMRWHVDANLIGFVVGHIVEGPKNDKNVLVLWTTNGQRVKFLWHLFESLLVVDFQNVEEVRRRCFLVT